MRYGSGIGRGMGWLAAAGFGCLLVNPGASSAVKTVGAQSAAGCYPVIAPDAAGKAQVQEAYGKLPLSFIQNNGQLNSKVKFYEKGSGRTVFFTEDGVYILLDNGRKADKSSSNIAVPSPGTGGLIGEPRGRNDRMREDFRKGHDSKPHERQLVKLMPLGANKSPKIMAENMQAGKVSGIPTALRWPPTPKISPLSLTPPWLIPPTWGEAVWIGAMA